MGVLVGGILIFLVLSILVLYSREKNETTGNIPTTTTTSSEKVILTPYPTIPPVENMTITMNSRRFVPDSFFIPKGGLVVFLNTTSEPITIEAGDENSQMLNIGTLNVGETKEIVFDKSGTYTYRNKTKPTMQGSIIIK